MKRVDYPSDELHVPTGGPFFLTTAFEDALAESRTLTPIERALFLDDLLAEFNRALQSEVSLAEFMRDFSGATEYDRHEARVQAAKAHGRKVKGKIIAEIEEVARARLSTSIAAEETDHPVDLRQSVWKTYEELKKTLGKTPSQVDLVEKLKPPFAMSRSSLQRKIRKGELSWPPTNPHPTF